MREHLNSEQVLRMTIGVIENVITKTQSAEETRAKCPSSLSSYARPLKH